MRKIIYLIIMSLFFSTCASKKVRIEIDNLSELGEICDTSFFHGINDSFTDFYYDDLCRVVGEPNEYDYDDYDEYKGDSKNPIYYFNDGKVLIHWSGDDVDPMGTMEFTPFENKPRYIDDCIYRGSEFGINDKTETVTISIKNDKKQIRQPFGRILKFEFKNQKLIKIWHD